MRRLLLLAVVGAFLIGPGVAPIGAQGPDGALTHLTTDFVTGDVVVGGTSLYRAGVNGFATKNINISGVPAGAEILSAYLYVQTTIRESMGEEAGMAGAKFKGHSLTLPGGSIAKALNWSAGTQACWSYGWNPRRRLVTYRADVLRFLEIGADGKHKANGNHAVQVADAGRGNMHHDDDEDPPTMAGPRAVGASLVLIYRHPNPAAPLRAIVIYDGGVTKRSPDTMTQRLQGFYQPAANADAKMIHIVGDGQLFFPEKLQLGSQSAINPFIGANGPRWDNTTFNLANSTLKTYPGLNTLTVSRSGLIPDCLSWSAMILSTKVKDTDSDGLLDIWETSATEILDPDGQALPNLQAMGADPNVKDLFFEIGYLHTPGYTGNIFNDPTLSYGGVTKPGHSHMPSEEALKIVGDAFASGPVTNPDGTPGPGPINVHFDVGDNYQSSPYVIPSNLAKGGNGISETMACAGPTPDSIVECPNALMPGQYPLHPGTVGWKTGYRFYRDEILGFDPGRKGIFRYVLSAHALGLPQSEFPCLNANGVPVAYKDGVCEVGHIPNPAFHQPKTNSGVADWAGGDIMVTLGGFDDSVGRPVGTDYMWAATMAHESGHTMGRRHGGDLFEPNCKPLYLSVMNYLYQLRGLPDSLGVPRLDFSRGLQVPTILSETALADDFQSDAVPYRIGWYAPKANSYLKNQEGASTKHCDGSPLLTDVNGNPTEPLMVRVDATQVGGLIDWNADGQPTFAGIQDINFDGFPQTALSASTSDWSKFRLNQLGARRSVGGLFLDKLGRPTVGPMSLNAGKGDLGKGDLGKGDLGKGDLGKGDLGKGDLGKGDLGKGDLGIGLDLGKGDLGKGDLGQGDLDVGGPGEPADEIDVPTAKAVTGGNPTPPSALAACLTDDGECYEGGDRPVRLDWLTPNVGRALRYLVYRFEVDPEQPFPPAILPTEAIATVYGIEGGLPPTTFIDSDAPAGRKLAYFLRAVFFDDETNEEVTSGISNFATITTPELQRVPLLVDFEEFTEAPPFFGTATPPLTVGIATFSGGHLLNATVVLPADPTFVYGTANFCTGCEPAITIDFSEPVSGFSALVLNGQPFVVTYTITDDQEGFTTVELASNFNSGAATVTLPNGGITKVVIRPSGEFESWDFFVDDIAFTPTGDGPP